NTAPRASRSARISSSTRRANTIACAKCSTTSRRRGCRARTEEASPASRGRTDARVILASRPARALQDGGPRLPPSACSCAPLGLARGLHRLTRVYHGAGASGTSFSTDERGHTMKRLIALVLAASFAVVATG